ncbi:MAG: hypothetical protein OEZ06_04965 [Myxococcales bacterium]|nr:hypothetical protein [Myxococcales bacterium]
MLTVKPAHAQRTWALDPFVSQGVDPGTVQTFRQLLGDELSAQDGGRVIQLQAPCADLSCAAAAGAQAGADVAVHGTLGRLGAKIVVSVSAADIAGGSWNGQPRASERMSVDRVEDLDAVASRMATALIGRQPVETTAELGNITHSEAKEPLRRRTRVGFLMNLQAIAPMAGYAGEQLGGGLEFGIWIETLHMAIEPRIGYRGDLVRGPDKYKHVPLELGLYYLPLLGDFSPLVGGGVGLHYLHEELTERQSVGEVLVSTSSVTVEDSIYGYSVYARAGLMVMRTYTASLLFSVDYALTVADFKRRDNEHGLRFNVGLVLGGSSR